MTQRSKYAFNRVLKNSRTYFIVQSGHTKTLWGIKVSLLLVLYCHRHYLISYLLFGEKGRNTIIIQNVLQHAFIETRWILPLQLPGTMYSVLGTPLLMVVLPGPGRASSDSFKGCYSDHSAGKFQWCFLFCSF